MCIMQWRHNYQGPKTPGNDPLQSYYYIIIETE